MYMFIAFLKFVDVFLLIKEMVNPRNIIISRTDAIGDVILTLPLAAVLKKQFPEARIGFMGKSYTRTVIEACKYVDMFIDVQDFLENSVTMEGEKPDCIIHVFPVRGIAKRAKQIGIPVRIGTMNRLYHLGTCNKLVRLSRKNSDLHESQLNLILLKPLGINDTYSLPQLGLLVGLEKIQPLPSHFHSLFEPGKYNIILHPKSHGSSRDWPLERFIELVRLLDPARYSVFISGTAKERALLQPLFDKVGNAVTDITGKMDLGTFISFINACDGLVAASTGPLHIAGALGKDAFGIYPPIRPLHPGRWAPIGSGVQVFVTDRRCRDCSKKGEKCHCMSDIQADIILQALEKRR